MKHAALKKTAKILRKKQTKYELAFGRKLDEAGLFHQPQCIIGPWIADFFLPAYKVVVEIDGSSHYKARGMFKDTRRDVWLEDAGYRVVHIANEDVWNFDLQLLFEDEPQERIEWI